MSETENSNEKQGEFTPNPELINALAGYEVQLGEVEEQPPLDPDGEEKPKDGLPAEEPSEEGAEESLGKQDPHMVNILDLPEDLQEEILATRDENYNSQQQKERRQKLNDLMSMSDKEFYQNYLYAKHLKTEERPDGFTEQQLQDEMEKLSPVQLRELVNNMKTSIKEHDATQREQRRKELLEKSGISTEFNEVEYKEQVEATINRNKDISEVFGLRFSEAEKKQADEAFREWTTIKPETGRAPFHDLIEDDDMLYKVIALIQMGEHGIKGKISEIKETVKSSMIKKLGIEPNSTEGGGTARIPTGGLDPTIFE